MTVDQAVRRYPEHTGAIRAVVEALHHYPGHDREVIDSIDPIRPDNPDRVIEPYALCDGGMSGRVEYTHLIRASYCADYGCLYGVTAAGQAHLWAD